MDGKVLGIIVEREIGLAEEKETTMEATAKGRTIGALRCLNCYARIVPKVGDKTLKCPNCQFEWRLYWIDPDLPRIRGPVWDVNRRMAEEAAKSKSQGGKK